MKMNKSEFGHFVDEYENGELFIVVSFTVLADVTATIDEMMEKWARYNNISIVNDLYFVDNYVFGDKHFKIKKIYSDTVGLKWYVNILLSENKNFKSLLSTIIKLA